VGANSWRPAHGRTICVRMRSLGEKRIVLTGSFSSHRHRVAQVQTTAAAECSSRTQPPPRPRPRHHRPGAARPRRGGIRLGVGWRTWASPRCAMRTMPSRCGRILHLLGRNSGGGHGLPRTRAVAPRLLGQQAEACRPRRSRTARRWVPRRFGDGATRRAGSGQAPSPGDRRTAAPHDGARHLPPAGAGSRCCFRWSLKAEESKSRGVEESERPRSSRGRFALPTALRLGPSAPPSWRAGWPDSAASPATKHAWPASNRWNSDK
jgi:hypothetical protein